MNSKKIKINEKTFVYAGAFFACILSIFYHVSDKLITGARWSSGLPLGGVDNFLYNGGSLYTVLENGLTPGSSYFPGNVLLALVFRLLFGYGAETALIFFAGFVAFFTFWGFSAIASENRKRRFWLSVVAAAFFIFGFPDARFYLFELHPDIPALMFFLWGIVFLDRYLKKKQLAFYILSTFFFMCAGLFKQNAIALYVGLGIYALFAKSLDWESKLVILFSEFVAGVGTLIVVFSIEGCWYNAVTVNASHPYLELGYYYLYSLRILRHNWLYVLISFVFMTLLVTGNIKLNGNKEKMYFAASLGWITFCLYGSAKEGANEGNFEAAIIAFMPFVLITFNNAFDYIRNVVDCKKVISDIKNIHFYKAIKRVSIVTASCIFAIYAISYTHDTIDNFKKFDNRIKLQNSFSQWLSTNYRDKNVTYNTKMYELLNHAQVHKKADLFTAVVMDLGGIVNDEKLNQMSEDQHWDVIITCHEMGKVKWPKTFSHFNKLDKKKFSDLDFVESIEVYVRKDNDSVSK